jgi:Ca-activated chloride channel family protein
MNDRSRLLAVILITTVACTTTPPPVPIASTAPAAAQPQAQAQVAAGSGTLRGQVLLDGLPLPGATITASNAASGSRNMVTDEDGRFEFKRLPAGTYLVRAELSGLATTVRHAIVSAAKATDVQVAMRAATISEAITVTAEAPAHVTSSAGMASVITDAATARAAGRRVSPHTNALVYRPDGAFQDRPQYLQFADHVFTATSKERTTTFAIDVDRASYANIRRFFNDGDMPPADAVRIEEMINYFTYDLPQPADAHPFSITTEVSGCPWNASNRLLRIGIQGRNLDQWKMAPNNLVFLIDVSGSMDTPESLPLVKKAFRVLVEQLRPEDRVAIVVYAGSEGLALPPTSGADKQTILDAIENLEAGGSTAGAAGIELAYEVAKENFLENGNNRVILATDGDFNVGISDIDELQTFIEAKRETGVFLTTIGVGTGNYQDALMETLADKGNGNYAYLDSLKEAEKVFRNELTGTLVTIAKDVKVQLEFDPMMVAAYRQIGYENRALSNADFTDDTKDAGELGAGHSVTALYEIVPRHTRGTIATVRLRYKQPNGAKSTEVSTRAVDGGKSAYEASPDMQFAAAVAEMGMLLRDSPHKGSASWDDVAQLARMSQGPDLDGTRAEFLALVDAAVQLSREKVAGK